MLLMIAFAAFQSKQTVWDLMALFAIGIMGIYMKRFDWPRPAFLIGFVLADQAEVHTYHATQFAKHKGPGYLFSPTVPIIATLIALTALFGYIIATLPFFVSFPRLRAVWKPAACCFWRICRTAISLPGCYRNSSTRLGRSDRGGVRVR